ncbi:MAG: hypothetical protein Q4F18_15215 [Clostridia bacterium]|nr:hypothetical protein [Clostridia bacterium]
MSQQKAASAARQEFYSTRDIERITGLGYTKAREIMMDFDRQQMTVHFGKSILVRREVFDGWTCAQDGFDKVTGQRNFKIIRGRRKA